MIVFIDIDGTIADASARLPFIMGPGKKDWDSFHHPELVAADPPIEEAHEALRVITTDELYTPIFLTGRPLRLYDITANWMMRNFSIETTFKPQHHTKVPLLMRGDKDYSSSLEYKRRWITEVFESYPVDDFMFIDDDLRNKEMYLKFGFFLHAPECWKVVHF